MLQNICIRPAGYFKINSNGNEKIREKLGLIQFTNVLCFKVFKLFIRSYVQSQTLDEFVSMFMTLSTLYKVRFVKRDP